MFEAAPEPGGMLRYGIPNYRIPNELVDREVELIKKTGVEIECNSPVGKGGISLKKLKKEYDAVFVGIGAHKDRKMGIEGEDLEGVWSSIEFLRKVNSGEKVDVGEKVIVVGGGNSAIDAARSALRMGAKDVTIVYRRSRVEMPAYVEEVEAAEPIPPEEAIPEEAPLEAEPIPLEEALPEELPSEEEPQAEPEPSAEPEQPSADAAEEEDPRIAKLRAAYEAGKISKELYEKNLARFKGQ